MKHSLIFLAAFAAGAALTGGLQAAPAPAAKPIIPPHDNNAPINISSDSFQADLNAKTGTYSGNVLITQADMKLRANTVKLSTVNSKLDKVFATGNVVVDSPKSGIVTGDNGVYSVGPRTVLMTGNVTLKKGKDVLTGAQLTVNLVTGQANLGGGAKTPGTSSGGRVKGVFIPNSQQAGPQ
jgi:lipopolysaccharide export system protein LptA